MFVIIERDFPARHLYTCFVSTLQANIALILMPFLFLREFADFIYNQNNSAVFTYAMPCMCLSMPS
jgi:hypothetical protein